MSAITVRIDNVYDDDFVRVEHTADVPLPEAADVVYDDYEEWAEEYLFPLTGTGRDGDAAYFVKITRFDDRPDLVGREFEYGL